MMHDVLMVRALAGRLRLIYSTPLPGVKFRDMITGWLYMMI